MSINSVESKVLVYKRERVIDKVQQLFGVRSGELIAGGFAPLFLLPSPFNRRKYVTSHEPIRVQFRIIYVDTVYSILCAI